MKKTLILLTFTLLFSIQAIADAKCFLAKENNTVIKQDGNCASRYAPCSSFKIALSLMGYDSGVLKDETHPEWLFKEGYVDWLEVWKQPQNPTSWMKNSCVWYSQVLTQKLGMNKFKGYVAKFNYGNQDVSGDKGQDNGLTNSWLSSSLAISPEEQTVFLQKLLDNKLPIRAKAHKMTRNILFVEALPHGWKLYGKTGSGRQLDKTGQKTDLQHGWFVGWIEKDGRVIVFADHIADDSKQESYAGPRAKSDAKERLLQLIDKLELIQARDINFFDKTRNRSVPVEVYVRRESEGKASAGIAKLPVVIISNGYGAKNTEYSAIANAMAALGYFVVSIQHDLDTDAPLPRTGNLFERRKPLWERGVQSILFVINELKKSNPSLALDKVTLIGHSNGGDISMMFTDLHPELVAKVISLDSLRYPFPTKNHIPILSLRANDTKADDGVLPESGATIVNLEDAKHIELSDLGSSEIRQKIIDLVTKFMKSKR
jgi:beta-lactamase class D